MMSCNRVISSSAAALLPAPAPGKRKCLWDSFPFVCDHSSWISLILSGLLMTSSLCSLYFSFQRNHALWHITVACWELTFSALVASSPTFWTLDTGKTTGLVWFSMFQCYAIAMTRLATTSRPRIVGGVHESMHWEIRSANSETCKCFMHETYLVCLHGFPLICFQPIRVSWKFPQ